MNKAELIEALSSYYDGNKAEAAYRRGDALEKRRLLLKDWEAYLG